MKKPIHTIWKEKEGSRDVWKVQAQKGILTFKTKGMAKKWIDTFKK